MYKKFLLLILLLIGSFSLNAQRIYSLVFDSLPQDLQLYPRNEKNEADIPIKGRIEVTGYNYMSVVVLRNGTQIDYLKAPITYDDKGIGTFSTQTKIKAELAEYNFKVYACKTADSVIIVERKNVVCGDIFLVNGQSNSYQGVNDEGIYKGEFARTFGQFTIPDNYSNYNPADTLWSYSNQGIAIVGMWATEIQKYIIEKYKIPVCIINGGSGGSSIDYNAARDAGNPANLATSYGRLLYRAQKSGAFNAIKGYIFRQGENEASGAASTWGSFFEQLYQNWKKDYPSVKKYYLFQINILVTPLEIAGLLRENQRQQKTIHPDIETIATVGTSGYDGIHYKEEGYRQSAVELFRLIDRDFYGSTDTDNINSPDIKKVYFSSSAKTEITLEFDAGQSLIWTADTTLTDKKTGAAFLQSMKDYIYLDGAAGSVASGKAIGNKIILALKAPSSATRLTYLPSFHDSSRTETFGGPFIKNKRGLRAFSFYEKNIDAFPDQLVYDMNFSKIPQDLQLFPRNEKNLGTIPVSGTVKTAGFTKISVSTYRNNTFYGYQSSALSYQNGSAGFSLKQTIKAEKAEYDIRVYLVKSNDSILVAYREKLVSGDVIVLSGQSNSTGFFQEKATNEYCRTFGKITPNLNEDPYNPADTLWALSNQDSYYNGVGTMGFEIQKQLLDNYGIPTCMINGGFHHSSALSHATRTASNPADLSNGYGRMLYRIQKAGVANDVKYFIFRQGETEAYNEGTDWQGNFGKLRDNLKLDLPNLQKMYVFQIDVIYYPSFAGAIIRDYQRRLNDIYPDVQSLATVGTKGFSSDGLHYSAEGYQQNGQEVTRLIAKDFYGLKDTLNIKSPNIRKIFYSNADKSELTLVFDEGQQLVYPGSYQPNQQVTLEMKDFFYLDGSNGKVLSGTADHNRIVLKLNGPQPAAKLNYLPPYLPTGGAYYPYTGPYLTNKLGMRAFSFYEAGISNILSQPELTASLTWASTIKLNWKSVPDASGYVLERKKQGDADFTDVVKITGNVLEYSDKNLSLNTQYIYRLRAINAQTESNYSTLVQISTPEGLASPQLQANATYFNKGSISWNTVPNAKNYDLSIVSNNVVIKSGTFNTNQTNYVLDNLTANTTYSVSVRAYSDITESPTITVSFATPALLASPELTASVTYFNAVKLSWKAISGAKTYSIERKTSDQASFTLVTTLAGTITEYADTKLNGGQTYTYRIKALADLTESPAITADAKTPSQLVKPELTAAATSLTSVKLSWKAISGASYFILERKLSTDADFKQLAKLDPGVLEYPDKTLTLNTAYNYRIKAFGNLTESDFTNADVSTPDYLAIPVLSTSLVTHEQITLKWNVVANASQYVLERKLPTDADFKEISRIDANTLTFTDKSLPNNTALSYRMKAISDVSISSDYGKLDTKTLAVLGTELEIAGSFSVYPNPVPGNTNLSIEFIKPQSGMISLVNLAGISEMDISFKQTEKLQIDVSNVKTGMYLVVIRTSEGTTSKKLFIQ